MFPPSRTRNVKSSPAQHAYRSCGTHRNLRPDTLPSRVAIDRANIVTRLLPCGRVV